MTAPAKGSTRSRGATHTRARRLQLLFGGMGRLSESSVVSIKNKSFSVTAEVEIPAEVAPRVW